jgi:hypothetical protein
MQFKPSYLELELEMTSHALEEQETAANRGGVQIHPLHI